MKHWRGRLLCLALSPVLVLLSAAEAAAQACTPAPSGLVSWWPGEGNGDDIIGGQTVSPQGSSSTFASAKVGQGFHIGVPFSGVDGFQAPGSALWNLQQLTVDAWARATPGEDPAGDPVGNIIAVKVLTDFPHVFPYNSWWLSYAPSTGKFNAIVQPCYITGAAADYLQSAGSFAAGQFHHVAMTYDGTDLRLFVNGLFEGQKTCPGPIAYSSNRLGIASHAFGTVPGRNFVGDVDEVEIFNRPLSQAEIQAIYNAGSAGKCQPPCAPPPTGMTAWWPGDGDTRDIAAGRDGTLVGGAGFGPGRIAQAFSFNGSGYVNVPDDAVWTLGSNDFTIDMWAKFNSLSGRDPFIAHDEGGGTLNKWIFWYDAVGHRPPFGPALRFHINGPGLGAFNPDPVVFPWNPAPNRWYHVAVTRSGTTYTLYIDGVRVISESDSTAIPDPSFPLTIGRAEAFFLNGSVDEAEIHGRALSASEIQAIFAAGSAGKCKAPAANAGLDQAVDEGMLVALDGSQSVGLSLSFDWQQLAGPPAMLSDPTSPNPSFGAPSLPGGVSGSQTLTFSLTVTDRNSQSGSDTVDVTVKNINNPPVADAGADQTVNEDSPVALSAANSFDPDGDPIVSYQWTQTGGQAVTLAGDGTATPTFTAPLLAGGFGGSETLSFDVTVSDGDLSATDTVQVTVEQVNHAPTADAGPDQTKFEGNPVTLDGTASGDPDGDPLTYSWSQLMDTNQGCDIIAVSLSDPTIATPSFTAPAVGPGGATLCFILEVQDPGPLASTDEVRIHVQNLNDPPACGRAQASPGTLWPPNHKLIAVGIVGVTDPNNNAVTISITSVTQDEPTNGQGDGDTSPDAVLQKDTVLLRAERSGGGNGRVYRVQFTAADGDGGVCSGAATVGVPPNMKPGSGAVDDGQIYDSTQP